MPDFSVPPNPSVTFKVRHEDADLLVVDKPARVATQPGLGHETDSLLSGLFARWGVPLQRLGKARDFGLLHRLDRGTSGLLIVALTPEAYDSMRAAFEGRRIRKYYWAIVEGVPRKTEEVINKPILEAASKERRLSKTARISGSGKPALTAYRVLATSPGASVVECRAITGRLHQVRAHLSAIGCPVLGDGLYGHERTRAASPRLALHAHRIAFEHPRTGETIDVSSPFPRELRGVLGHFGLPRPDRPASGGVEGLGQGEDDAVGEQEA
ncbi:MAG: RluA family pseudouridine synthase [Phycisphaerae bacterium]|nr:RluA family pseudouridine synthase [Phycisphaerae bacterium]